MQMCNRAANSQCQGLPSVGSPVVPSAALLCPPCRRPSRASTQGERQFPRHRRAACLGPLPAGCLPPPYSHRPSLPCSTMADKAGLTQRLVDNSSRIHKKSNTLLLTKVQGRQAARHRSPSPRHRSDPLRPFPPRPSPAGGHAVHRPAPLRQGMGVVAIKLAGGTPPRAPALARSSLPDFAALPALPVPCALHPCQAIGCFYLVFVELEAALRRAFKQDKRALFFPFRPLSFLSAHARARPCNVAVPAPALPQAWRRWRRRWASCGGCRRTRRTLSFTWGKVTRRRSPTAPPSRCGGRRVEQGRRVVVVGVASQCELPTEGSTDAAPPCPPPTHCPAGLHRAPQGAGGLAAAPAAGARLHAAHVRAARAPGSRWSRR